MDDAIASGETPLVESTCPNCKKKNEHEDYLFEVACTCGSRYNPFMALEETPAASAPATTEPQFAEANAAFADIRSFGDDNVSQAAVPAAEPEAGFTDLSAPPPEGSAPPTVPIASAPSVSRSSAGGATLAAGPAMEPLPPVSASVDFDGNLPNPLEPLVQQLWEKASGAGGSACTEVRWAFSPDGQKIVGSCVPVRRA